MTGGYRNVSSCFAMDGDAMPHLVVVPRSERGSWREAVVTGSPDGVLLVGRDGRVADANPAAERIFRVPAGTMAGRPVQEFVPARLRDEHARNITEFFATAVSARGMADRGAVPAVRADGEEFMAEIALIPVTVDGAGAVACIVRDATERLEMEAALVRAEKLESLRVLSAGLAHDFNNILATILGNAEFGLQVTGEESPARLALHDIREAGRRAAEMVQQMLRFAGRGEAAREPVELTLLAGETLQLLRSALGPGVRVQTDFSREPVVVVGDAVGIRQVLMNLVINAGEAMSGSGTLTVRTGLQAVTARYLRNCQRSTCHGCAAAVPGQFGFIEVADTGVGMDAATRERIFDPYFSTKFAGRGLGLAAVAGVVAAHRGIIRVTSRPGRGTTFRVLLPAEAATV